MSDSFEIEKGVELPPKRSGRKPGTSPFPFHQMKVGDSFFVPSEDRQKMQRNLAARGSRALNGGGKVTTRLVEGGVRVWRIA